MTEEYEASSDSSSVSTERRKALWITLRCFSAAAQVFNGNPRRLRRGAPENRGC